MNVGSPPGGEAAPLHLTLLTRGAGFAAMLTDLRGLACIEDSTVDAAEWQSLCREFAACRDATPSAAPATADPGGDARAQRLGRRLFGALPPGVAALLRETPPRDLALHLDRGLAGVPWELAHDGEAVLGTKLRVSRRIVAPGGASQASGRSATTVRRSPLQVLLLSASKGRLAAAVEAGLAAPLRSLGAIEVDAAEVDDPPSAEILRLVGGFDVVLWIGAPDLLSSSRLAEMAAQAEPPLLLGLQATSVAAEPGTLATPQAEASRLGLQLVTLHSRAGPAIGFELLVALVAAVLRGASGGEALRLASAEVHRRFGLAALVALQPAWIGDGGASLLPSAPAPAPADNLRQLTIMSIDLVESTRLLAALGAERYSDVLSDFHRRSAALMRNHGGVPDDFQGDDGSMCYFGLPVAREDAVVQALRAALAIVDAVRALGLGVRIGVVTGQVVIRDGQPIGAAVHLAARLQSIAAPGTVVVGEATRRIAGDRFQFQALEKLALLKGFDRPQRCFVLLGQAPLVTQSLSGLRHAAPGITPFVGRAEELRLLEAHWAEVDRGVLRVILVRGEAGIGKSRLVREFRRGLVERGHEVFECRCAPEHVNSVFHPLIESVRGQLHIAPGDAPPSVIARLRAMAAAGRGEVDEASIALLTDMLGIAAEGRHPTLARNAERRRQATMELLLELAVRRVEDRSACLIVEDVQWLDPSTAEYLGRLAAAASERRLMIICTVRCDEPSRWPTESAHLLDVAGLSLELSRALVLGTCGDARLPSEMVQRIALHGDGVPLFIEESTRMALERGAGSDAAETALQVPATILDLLTARLDALGPAKRLAQIGGMIGREFSLTLLQAVLERAGSPISAGDALAELAELVRAGVLLARRDSGDTGFAFKHALLRDAAYRSLLERDRLRLHEVVAGVIADQFADLAERQPQLLAFHYTAARQDAQALRCWELAVRHASTRSAHVEAMGYLESALGVLGRQPPGLERDRRELKLQLLHAARLIATHGYGAEQVQRAYARAMELAEALDDGSAAISVLLGFESYHFMRADFANAERCAREAHARLPRHGRPIHGVQTQWALANILMHQGDMEAAVQRMDACRAEYAQLEHRPDMVQDPGIMCLCYSAWSLWQLGFPDEALARMVTVVARAESMQHPFSLGEAYGFKAAVQHFRGEHREALASAERAITVCEEHGFSVWLAHARLMRGRVVAALGQVEQGLDEMREGYARWAATGAIVTTPFYLTMRAEGCALAGRPAEGRDLLQQALEIVERTGERYYEPEIRRQIGCTTLQLAAERSLDRSAEAEGWMRQAHDIAAARGMASLGLRAALSLAELWTAQGLHERAVEWLGRAHERVIGGQDTHDVATARARLAEWRSFAAS